MLFPCWVIESLYFLALLLLEITWKFSSVFKCCVFDAFTFFIEVGWLAVCTCLQCVELAVKFLSKYLDFLCQLDVTWIQLPSNVQHFVCTLLLYLFHILNVFCRDNPFSRSSSCNTSSTYSQELSSNFALWSSNFIFSQHSHMFLLFSLILLPIIGAVLTECVQLTKVMPGVNMSWGTFPPWAENLGVNIKQKFYIDGVAKDSCWEIGNYRLRDKV